MEHVAIMKKSWRLIDKILSGQKTIESRWYTVRHAPWDKIRKGEVVYFKNSDEPVNARATVKRVLQFDDLTPSYVRSLLFRYGKEIGFEKEEIGEFYRRVKDKRYCVLIFLRKPVAVEPFEIDKTGFGTRAAWIAVDHLAKIRK